MNHPDDPTSKADWKRKKAPFYAFEKSDPNLADRLGSYGIWMKEVKEWPSHFKAAITGTGNYSTYYTKEIEKGNQTSIDITKQEKPAQQKRMKGIYMFLFHTQAPSI